MFGLKNQIFTGTANFLVGVGTVIYNNAPASPFTAQNLAAVTATMTTLGSQIYTRSGQALNLGGQGFKIGGKGLIAGGAIALNVGGQALTIAGSHKKSVVAGTYALGTTVGTATYNSITGEKIGFIGMHKMAFDAASTALKPAISAVDINGMATNSSLTTHIITPLITPFSNTGSEIGELFQIAKNEYVAPAITTAVDATVAKGTLVLQSAVNGGIDLLNNKMEEAKTLTDVYIIPAINDRIIPALETGIQKTASAVVVTAGKAVKAGAAGIVDGAKTSFQQGVDYIKKDPKNLPHLVYGPGAPPKTVGLAEFAFDKFKVLANETSQTVVDSLPTADQVAETGIQVLKAAAVLLAVGTVTYIAYSKYKAAAAIKTATTTDAIKDIVNTPRTRIAVKRGAV